jgi:hypothetical protein
MLKVAVLLLSTLLSSNNMMFMHLIHKQHESCQRAAPHSFQQKSSLTGGTTS